MALITSRRSFLTGLGAALAAPAVVPYASLMPVRGIVMPRGLSAQEIYNLCRSNQIESFRLGADEYYVAIVSPPWDGLLRGVV
jgi:hypothetical protein